MSSLVAPVGLWGGPGVSAGQYLGFIEVLPARCRLCAAPRMDQAIQFVAPLVLPIAASAAAFYGVLAGTQVTTV